MVGRTHLVMSSVQPGLEQRSDAAEKTLCHRKVANIEQRSHVFDGQHAWCAATYDGKQASSCLLFNTVEHRGQRCELVAIDRLIGDRP